jgi:hypothetical protein
MSAGAAAPKRSVSSLLISALAVWMGISQAAVFLIAAIGAPPNTRAVILMGTGLILLWIVLGGLSMRRFREPVRAFVQAIPWPWPVKFVLFCTLLALTEEAITVTMTNLAPLFGVPLGAAYITASANYLDVVGLHSVVVFVPMFIGWAWMLKRWDFSPNAVLVLFGLTGLTSEISFGGWSQAPAFGFWIFVYGLMIYLPAYCLPPGRGAQKPKGWHYPLAVILPTVAAIPVAIVVNILHPIKIHFPSIPPNS